MDLVSWKDDRLPEMVWAALICVAFGQENGLGHFRRILNFISQHEKTEALSDLTLTGISNLELTLRDELISFIVAPPDVAKVLATLRLFKSLPAFESWDQRLPVVKPSVELLMSAVGSTLAHQSQNATDCRWLRIMGFVVTGKFDMPLEIREELLGYPNKGDQQKVRPTIRAIEIGFGGFATPDLAWPKAF